MWILLDALVGRDQNERLNPTPARAPFRVVDCEVVEVKVNQMCQRWALLTDAVSDTVFGLPPPLSNP